MTTQQIKFAHTAPWLTGIPDDPRAFGVLCQHLHEAVIAHVTEHAEGRRFTIDSMEITINPHFVGRSAGARLTIVVTFDDS